MFTAKYSFKRELNTKNYAYKENADFLSLPLSLSLMQNRLRIPSNALIMIA